MQARTWPPVTLTAYSRPSCATVSSALTEGETEPGTRPGKATTLDLILFTSWSHALRSFLEKAFWGNKRGW